MDDRTGNLSEMGFTESDKHLSGLNGEAIGKILFKSSDVVLIVDRDDNIIDASFLSDELFQGGGRNWRGKSLREIITSESLEKVNELLDAARKGKANQARQVNHPLPQAEDLPVSYQAAKLNEKGNVVLFGRSEGQVANLQRRLMSSQLAMEREVTKLRNFENRYRAAFQLSQLPKIIVDAGSLRILDINTSATSILGKTYEKLENKRILSLFDDEGSSILHKLLLAAIDNQHQKDAVIRLMSGELVNIRIVTFRQDGHSLLLLFFSPTTEPTAIINDTVDSKILSLFK
ncbi:MAG: PAS domain-containing protein [Pseudomonadota bacterium]